MSPKDNQTQKPEIKFGTDGWRAVIGEGFTFHSLRIVAQAYADYLKQSVSKDGNLASVKRTVVVGFDCRFMADKFAAETARIIEHNGFRVFCFDKPTPTPIISWTVRSLNAIGGIVITASHNSFEYCGVKLKTRNGTSAPLTVTSDVEGNLFDNLPPSFDLEGERLSNERFSRNSEASEQIGERYMESLKSLVDIDLIARSKQSVVIDSMHGAGGHWIESFFRGRDLSIETIRGNPDPTFGGTKPDPIKENLSLLRNRVKETDSVLGIATDGDADRIGVVGETGNVLTTPEIAAVVLLHLVRQRKRTGGVVCTFSHSVLIKRIAEKLKLEVFETQIGFKHVGQLMMEKNALIGLEESGGIGISGHIPERDPILAGLIMIEAVITAGKPLTELISDIRDEFGEFCYTRNDLKVKAGCVGALISRLKDRRFTEFAGESVNDVRTLDGVKFIFEDESWILFRASGTEPVIRLYAEANSESKLSALLSEGEDIVLSELSR